MTVIRYLVRLHRAPGGEIDDITIEPCQGTVVGDLFFLHKGGETSWVEGALAFEHLKDALDSVRLTIQNRLRVWEKLRDKFAQTALGEVCSTEDGEAAAKALAGQEGPCVVRPCTCGAIVTGEPHTLLCDRVGFLDTA